MILVAGATGNVECELVKLLLDSGEEVGAVTRDPGSAWAPQIRQAGAMRGAYGDAATSSIHERDIAAVAASALASPARRGTSSDTVQQVLGRPALTIAQWAADHATAFQN